VGKAQATQPSGRISNAFVEFGDLDGELLVASGQGAQRYHDRDGGVSDLGQVSVSGGAVFDQGGRARRPRSCSRTGSAAVTTRDARSYLS
jgi:hypothetical protein